MVKVSLKFEFSHTNNPSLIQSGNGENDPNRREGEGALQVANTLPTNHLSPKGEAQTKILLL